MSDSPSSADPAQAPQSALSPTARRTRTAIMTAAIDLLAAHPEAPMKDIAEAAGVSRSTLHRYFADRATLRLALDELTVSQWREAVRAARMGEGTGLAAFRRLSAEALDRLDVLAWWMVTPELWEPQGDAVPEAASASAVRAAGETSATGEAQGAGEPAGVRQLSAPRRPASAEGNPEAVHAPEAAQAALVPEDAEIVAALHRGAEDGSIDPKVEPAWLLSLLWAVLYSVRFTPAEGGLSAFDARAQGLRTLLKAAAAEPSGV
ncbi:TetR/AcrR family transcriptional regulator [Brevibacterium album]|uniref:TetR/AcrR family transcriptional regulator n=1 Tax=Brevibacterium album TaxID=417948 RepID=UPI000684F741|nr:TetR/AcrR family transcriptional regulator [Brevibacterium album]